MIIRNKLYLICTIYTAITVFSSILNLAQGRTHDTHEHLLIRFVIVCLAVGSMYTFEWLEKLSYYLVILIHYLATQSLIFALVWVYGFFAPLHPDAFRDIFFNYTTVYIAVAALFIILRKKRGQA